MPLCPSGKWGLSVPEHLRASGREHEHASVEPTARPGLDRSCLDLNCGRGRKSQSEEQMVHSCDFNLAAYLLTFIRQKLFCCRPREMDITVWDGALIEDSSSVLWPNAITESHKNRLKISGLRVVCLIKVKVWWWGCLPFCFWGQTRKSSTV